MNIEIDKSIFEAFPKSESQRLFYREITLSDSRDILLIRSNDEVMKFMDRYKMESLKDADDFIKSVVESYKNKRGISWGIIEKDTNKFIGYFGFWRIIAEHCRAEIGYALKPGYWGKGYMTETIQALIRYGFGKIKFHSIEANVNPQNESSIRLLEKLGFKKEAYFRENILFDNKFIDSVIYSLLEKDFIDV